MGFYLVLVAALSGTVVLSPPSPVPPAKQGPCEKIVMTCKAAGFVKGGSEHGNGLLNDCVRPIALSQLPPGNASKPLPYVDPRVVEACRATQAAAHARKHTAPAH
jgi:hypothetical protein